MSEFNTRPCPTCGDVDCTGLRHAFPGDPYYEQMLDPRDGKLAQAEKALAELRAIADQLRTDLELLTLAETQRRPSIIAFTGWKARNP